VHELLDGWVEGIVMIETYGTRNMNEDGSYRIKNYTERVHGMFELFDAAGWIV
jgi:hypothetical protein